MRDVQDVSVCRVRVVSIFCICIYRCVCKWQVVMRFILAQQVHQMHRDLLTDVRRRVTSSGRGIAEKQEVTSSEEERQKNKLAKDNSARVPIDQWQKHRDQGTSDDTRAANNG